MLWIDLTSQWFRNNLFVPNKLNANRYIPYGKVTQSLNIMQNTQTDSK